MLGKGLNVYKHLHLSSKMGMVARSLGKEMGNNDSHFIFPVVMHVCEDWTIKKAEHWRMDAFKFCCWRKLLRVPWNSKETQPVNPKGNQLWIFIGSTDAEAEAPVLWSPDVKSQLIGKDPDAGKDWKWEEKETTEDKMVGWHHWLKGHEFKQTPGDSEGPGGLACCSPWGRKESDVTQWLNNSNNSHFGS